MKIAFPRGRSRPTTSAKSRPGTAKVTPLNDDTEANVKENEKEAKERKKKEDERHSSTSWTEKNINYHVCSHQETQSGDCEVCGTIDSFADSLANGSAMQDDFEWIDTHIATQSFHGEISLKNSLENEKNHRGTKKEKCKEPIKYIRFNPDNNVKLLFDRMKSAWGLSLPQVLITVAGGAFGYKLDVEVGRQFKKGLLNVANNEDIWITTGGTDYGVMSFVGKAIEEHRQNQKKQADRVENESNSNVRAVNPVLIGFVPWNIVRGRVNLKKEGNTNGDDQANQSSSEVVARDLQKISELQKNWKLRINTDHTHFVFVEKGTMDNDENDGEKCGHLGSELALRARFEDFIYAKCRPVQIQNEKNFKENNKKDDPDEVDRTTTEEVSGLKGLVVGVLLEGGLYSLQTVAALIVKGIPVVVAEGSGRMADVIAFAIQNTGKPDSEKPADLERKLKDTLEKKELAERAEQIWQKLCEKGANKLKIYDIRDPYELDLSEVLLDTALKTVIGDDETAKEYRMDILRLTVGWNCSAIAKTIIFNKKRNWEEESWRTEIKEMFWHCVQKNQHQFISLLLDNDCITSKDLIQIFFEKCFNNPQALQAPQDAHDEDGCMLKPAIKLIGRMIDLEIDVKKLMELKTEYNHRHSDEQSDAHGQAEGSCSSCCNCVSRYMNRKKQKKSAKKKLDEFEENQLVFTCFFFLSTYLRHHETAKVFWERGTNFLANMLLGMRLYKSMADDEPDRENEFLEKARDFEQIAMDLLEISNERDVVKLRELLIAGNTLSETHSVLGLAELAGHEQFVAHSSCQRVLDEVWFGAIRKERALYIFPKIWAAILLPIPMLWCMKYNGLGNILDSGKKHEAERQKTFADQNQHRIKIVESEASTESVYKHPESVNCFKMFCYLHRAPITKFFITLMVYILFLGLFMWVVIGELPADVQWKEFGLDAFMVCFTAEEIMQIIAQPGRKKLHRYRSDLWNLMDGLGILLFWLAFGLRFGLRRNSKNTARVFYLFDLFFWFMRSTHFFNLSKELGPVLTMILNMIPKLIRFCGIWLLFIYSFGIIMKSIAEPKHADDVHIIDLINILSFSYWQIFGELSLEKFDDSIHRKSEDGCTNGYKDGSELPPCPYWPRLSIYFLAVYLLLGNILLTNLLIAMFSSVYDDVNRRSVAHWKSKRLSLIVEYHTRSFLPPPFTVLYHIFFAFRRKKYREQIKRALGLRIKHSKDLLTRLGTFEREVKEEYLLLKEKREALDVNRKVMSLEEEVEEMATNVRETKQEVGNVKQELRNLGARFDHATFAKELKRTTDNLCREVTENLREQVTRLKSSLEEEAALRKSAEKTLEDVKNMLRSSKTSEIQIPTTYN